MAGKPREKIWVVRDGDGRTVGDIVRRAGEDAEAIADGRVFLGKKRVTRGDQPVRAGDAVRIGPAAPSAASIEVLFVRDGLAAVVKPAGLPTVPDHAGAAHSLVALTAKAVGRRDLRVTSRLDRDVSGVVVFALDEAAEERLKRARAEGRYQRRYVALASGSPGPQGVWDAPIGRAGDPRLRRVRGPDAKEARTRWRAIATASSITMLAVDPVTGRTHQIRVHASDAGAPLVGDRDYGGPTRLVLASGAILSPSRIALHAARVVVPGEHEPIEARAPIPAELERLWTSLGGASDAWPQAIEAALGGEGQPWDNEEE